MNESEFQREWEEQFGDTAARYVDFVYEYTTDMWNQAPQEFRDFVGETVELTHSTLTGHQRLDNMFNAVFHAGVAFDTDAIVQTLDVADDEFLLDDFVKRSMIRLMALGMDRNQAQSYAIVLCFVYGMIIGNEETGLDHLQEGAALKGAMGSLLSLGGQHA